MRNGFLALIILFSALILPARAQQAGLPDRQAGIAPDWEVRRMVEEAERRISQLAHVVQQVHEDTWPPAAKSERESLGSVRAQLTALEQNLTELKREPERLSVLLEAVTRLDTILRQLDALRPAIVRYQDPGLAIDLDRLLAGPSASREKLFSHASDLARFLEDQIRFLKQDIAQCEQTPRERQRMVHPRAAQSPKRQP